MDFTPDPSAMQKLQAMARPKLERACQSLVVHIQTVKLSKGRRTQGDVLTEGEPPYAYFGQLRKSIYNRWKEGDPNTQQVGTPLMHGRIQETGASITGKRLLTIPRSEEAVRFMKRPGASARDFPRKLVMIPSRRRAGVFFLVEQRRGGKKNLARTEIHFILAKHVRIPPHPFIVPAVVEHGPRMMQEMAS